MTCYTLRDKNGRPCGVICGKLGPKCKCGSLADELACDYPIGEGLLCSVAMCAGCATQVGPDLHYCRSHMETWIALTKAKGLLPRWRPMQ